jgi:hypothetical protein
MVIRDETRLDKTTRGIMAQSIPLLARFLDERLGVLAVSEVV